MRGKINCKYNYETFSGDVKRSMRKYPKNNGHMNYTVPR